MPATTRSAPSPLDALPSPDDLAALECQVNRAAEATFAALGRGYLNTQDGLCITATLRDVLAAIDSVRLARVHIRAAQS